MKKKILLLMGIFSLGILNAQIGINTESPLGLLHAKGSVSDLVISPDGYIGIGTVSPSYMLDIKTSGDTPIKINTGAGLKEGMVLASDANGGGYWTSSLSNSKQQSGKVGQSFLIRPDLYHSSAPAIMNGSVYKVTEDGNYLVTVRWWGAIKNMPAGRNSTSVLFDLRKNYTAPTTAPFYESASIIDSHAYYVAITPMVTVTASIWFCFDIFFLAPQLVIGDELCITLMGLDDLKSMPSNVAWVSGAASTAAVLMPNFIFSKI